MKSMIYIFFVILFFFSACDQQSTTPDSENDLSKPKGIMKISLDMTNAPSEVIRLEGKLDNNSDEINFDFEIIYNFASALIEDVPSGNWMLKVDAFDVNDVIIYTGKPEVTVNSGVVTFVDIHLIPATRSLEITVTWGVLCKDIDGNVYRTVKIADQWWMAENLKVTHYRNGEAIPNVTDDTEWTNLFTGAWCSYNNDDTNIETYGRLYNWYAVDTRIIAPAGWLVPSKTGWQILADNLGGDNVAGGKLKETGTAHWYDPNSGATNESGFSALPAGIRYSYDGTFHNMGKESYFWVSTEGRTSTSAWSRTLSSTSPFLDRRDFLNRQHGFSVRCVRYDIWRIPQ